ncbi:MAG TPA: NAD(+)/NADH kinase [Kiritimatiellia bacterium]|nr:NAD(+)/NADH kinase [Kiritimatiellia bacterium]HMP33553.1 NAD(+)/NADH kinase [Kiritimatiellia bacterium]
MKTIGLIVHTTKSVSADALRRLTETARRLNVDLCTCPPYGDHLTGIRCVETAACTQAMDALVALGGDGTLLRAVGLIAGRDIPVLGVNLGRLGFLTSVTESELEHGLEALVAGTYTTSARTMLDGTIVNRKGASVDVLRALNDVVVGWGQSTRIVTLDVAINQEPVASYRCDGIIVSTPTGSTGHSLSSGGPILHPDAPALLLNVICPHTLSARPVVVPDNAEIRITVKQTSKQLLLSVDGQDGRTLSEGDALVIRKATERFNLVHLPGYQYFAVLRKKLHWSGSSS